MWIFVVLFEATSGLILMALFLMMALIFGAPLVVLCRRMPQLRRLSIWGGLLGILAFTSTIFVEVDWGLIGALRSMASLAAIAVLWRVVKSARSLMQDSRDAAARAELQAQNAPQQEEELALAAPPTCPTS